MPQNIEKPDDNYMNFNIETDNILENTDTNITLPANDNIEMQNAEKNISKLRKRLDVR